MDAFRARGIGVAAVLPEPPETLRAFASARRLGYPLLSDARAAAIRRLGLLDPLPSDYEVPYAGSFLLDAEGRVTAKFFESETQYRRTAASILALEGGPMAGAPSVAPHFKARAWSSNRVLVPGQRVTLGVDLELPPGHHAYAPGAAGYRGLDLKLEGAAVYEAGPLRAPAPRPLFFAPLRETVPVLEGRVRLSRDVVAKWRPALKRLGEAVSAPAPIGGTLEYQVCTDTVCHPPGSLPLRFDLVLQPWTR